LQKKIRRQERDAFAGPAGWFGKKGRKRPAPSSSLCWKNTLSQGEKNDPRHPGNAPPLSLPAKVLLDNQITDKARYRPQASGVEPEKTNFSRLTPYAYEVVAAFRASGKGWQTDWCRAQRLAEDALPGV